MVALVDVGRAATMAMDVVVAVAVTAAWVRVVADDEVLSIPGSHLLHLQGVCRCKKYNNIMLSSLKKINPKRLNKNLSSCYEAYQKRNYCNYNNIIFRIVKIYVTNYFIYNNISTLLKNLKIK